MTPFEADYLEAVIQAHHTYDDLPMESLKQMLCRIQQLLTDFGPTIKLTAAEEVLTNLIETRLLNKN